MTALGILWFCLIFVLIAGYFVLDGFDLGRRALSPFVAKNDRERAIVRRSIGPVWDGNEVWLLTAGGARVRRVRAGLRHHVLRFLPGHHAGAHGPDRPRRLA